MALDLALAHPDRASALVLVAAAIGGQDETPELAAFDAAEDELLDAGRIDEAVDLNVRTWLDGRDRDAVPVSPEVRSRLAAMQRKAFERLLAAHEGPHPPGPVRWLEPPAATRLGEVRAPTLVVSGAHDLPSFREVGELLVSGIPGARSAVLDTAHLPGLERPEELNRLVLDFLAELGV